MKIRSLSLGLAFLLGSCQFLTERFGPDRCEGEISVCNGNILQTCEGGFIKNKDCGDELCLAAIGACDPCNNGVIDANETCDDGQQCTNGTLCKFDADCNGVGDGLCLPRSGDGCDELCQVEIGFACTGEPSVCDISCGNGSIDPGEQCDDGNDVLTDACPSGPGGTCQNASCGDGFVSLGEEGCDDGKQCTDEAPCQTNDDCNGIGDSSCLTRSGDGCTIDCTIEVCGDGVINNSSESCDDGNTADGDGCRANCTVEFCGDGLKDANEICDDGNTAGGDGCSADCQSNEICGNNILDADAGEECDDNNSTSEDGCSAGCLVEGCGDGVFQAGLGEQCDDNNNTGGDGCDASCFIELCGNNITSFDQNGLPEQCDDGNTAVGDGCNAQCQFESCGDGTVGQGEQCDDGNAAIFDGCSLCQIDPGFLCNGQPSSCVQACGNGVIDASVGETCDDNNAVNADGCTLCQIDPGFICSGQPSSCEKACGNGVVDASLGETCDDSNQTNDDGCESNCTNTCDKIASAEGATAATDPATGHCYLQFAQPLNWASAKADCATLGNATFPGHLATITSSAENTFVRNIDFSPALWIGATDLADATIGSSEDQWRWITNERFSRFIGFSNPEPNNANGQNCGTFFGNSLTWDDDNCNVTKEYICEIDFGRQCGNGVVEQGEICDDGNLTNGDGCSSTCSTFSCNEEQAAGGSESATTTFSNGCFVRFSTNRNFDAAQNDCIARGGFLATVAVDNENVPLDVIEGNDDIFWIGLKDTVTEGAFQWVTGEFFGFEDFNGAPPSNNNDDCVEYTSNDDWNDIPCSDTIDYVCEF